MKSKYLPRRQGNDLMKCAIRQIPRRLLQEQSPGQLVVVER
jgi:hypothetical protein